MEWAQRTSACAGGLRLLPVHAQMRLRGATDAHLDEGGDAFERDRQALRIDTAALVHQFRQHLHRVVRVLQPRGLAGEEVP